MYLLLSLSLLIFLATADIPAACFVEHSFGPWELVLSKPQLSPVEKCTSDILPYDRLRLILEEPNVAHLGTQKGTWTLVYNQGIGIEVAQMSFFFFFDYEQKDNEVTSFCDRSGRVHGGWYHNLKTNEYGCIHAIRKSYVPPLPWEVRNIPFIDNSLDQTPFSYSVNPSSNADHVTLNGPKKLRFYKQVDPMNMFYNDQSHPNGLPVEFNWLDHEGIVPEVRNQQHCGSCYAFGHTAAMMARIRIKSDGKKSPILSTQHVVSCGAYTQGCEGGFGYTVSRFAFETGIVEEEHFPYVARDDPCDDVSEFKHWKVKSYGIVGNYYGNTSEEAMMRELVENGPFAVSFTVPTTSEGKKHPSFDHYKSGVYMFNETPIGRHGIAYVETNHVVAIVGYGVENGLKYWLVQNSWGETWGAQGYFKIVRGIDNLGIESLAGSNGSYCLNSCGKSV
ncbi:hypothetical protein GEMRC1_005661 [Eukaryota sp. GEM-RC1]